MTAREALPGLLKSFVRYYDIKEEGIVKEGDKIVISAGVPLDIPGNTNMIRVEIA